MYNEDILEEKPPAKTWRFLIVLTVLIAAGGYALAINLGGVRDALVDLHETALRETTVRTATIDDQTAPEPFDATVTAVGDEVPIERVDASTLAEPLVGDLSRRIADLELSSAIRDGIERHPELASARVRVQVVDGLAVLSGTTVTADQLDAVEQIAIREGAESVENEIVLAELVDGAEDPGAQLARRVEFELYSTDAFDLDRIEISEEAGEIRLAGTVRSLAERLLAGRIAAEVLDVVAVVNELSVTEPSSSP